MPLTLFGSVYLATFLGAGYLATLAGAPLHQVAALLAVIVATAVTVSQHEGGRWPLGFFVAPRLAVRELLLGSGVAVLLIGACDGLIVLSTSVRHAWSGGFPAGELLLVYVPAVLHEELLFRGYPLQKVWQWRRGPAIVFTAVVFAALHGGNSGVSWLAMINLFLAGVMLAVAWERYRRLWFPIGIHFAWNILSGPLLGYDVSGYVSHATLLRTTGGGPGWLTGGAFGIEGSAWMIVVEGMAIALLTRRRPMLRTSVVEDTE